MSELTTDNLRPMGKDLLIRHIDMNRMKGGSIVIKETADEDTTQYFEVLGVGPKVSMVKKGDIVVIPWKNITPPFEFDHPSEGPIKVGITDEGQVLGVVDGD